MDTGALKKFAQSARNLLIDQVTSKLDLVLDDSAPARREHPQAIKDLENAIRRDSRSQVIEQVAYTWFNRFTALRYMDVNGYTQIRTVSPADNATRPELLSEAMAGNYPDGAPPEVAALLEGRTPSNTPQAEAYRLLLVHACNGWHTHMPFLFEEIDDYTELLMPEDLLSQTSILAELRKVMTEDACRDVEIIGWLYQFYISEKKDQVFAGLKKNQKITAENIPAATQLFTPHWIVRYLVENSLGRLWLLNRSQSRLAERMDYYIAPEEPETDFLRITRPEDIRICDPAAGSGHMLTYAFDLLTAIYEEEGYDPDEIPALILTHNLTGVEIDDRAGALAAFALAMKAAARLGRRRFLRMEAKPDICVLQNVAFTEAEMQDLAAVVGKDLFTEALRETLGQFEQAKNFGSLIVPKLRDPAEALRVVDTRDFGGDLLLKEIQERVVAVLRMAEALSPKYHVVVANPPYMGSGGMNPALKKKIEIDFKEYKADLFSAFIRRCRDLGIGFSRIGMMTPNVWMYISSHQKLRDLLLKKSRLTNLLELPLSGFKGATVQICAFNFSKETAGKTAQFSQLTTISGDDAAFAKAAREATRNFQSEARHIASLKDFEKIPGNIIAYWVSPQVFEAFEKMKPLSSIAVLRKGMVTAENESFIRNWFEVERKQFAPGVENRDASIVSGKKWFPYTKGGEYRRWFGNNLEVVDWRNDGNSLRSKKHHKDDRIAATNFNLDYIFQEAGTYSSIGTGSFSLRYVPRGFLFDQAGAPVFFDQKDKIPLAVSLMNSKVAQELLRVLSQTMNFTSGDLSKLPVPLELQVSPALIDAFDGLVKSSQSDWDAFETSWDFTTLPLLQSDHRAETLEGTYTTLRTHWQGMTDQMQRLEEENNRIFIDAYGLQDELTPEVPIEEITLTCNPAYRYGVKGNEQDRETRLRADTMAEFLHYAVGCMFGRYSLDAPGLILANQGETLADYLARVREPSFMPDEDNVIPVLDADWFPDDITERFRLFLRVTFGEAHFRENLRYIEDALGKDIRKYFTKDFYADHVKRYKKRPIYWMVSSPNGTFNALIYMHRYRSDTVSVLLNEYLREFITKLEGERARLDKLADDPTATQGARTKAVKEAQKLAKQIDELNAWESDVVFPLAQKKIEIDLDDGVKANYPKFGAALKKITGLS